MPHLGQNVSAQLTERHHGQLDFGVQMACVLSPHDEEKGKRKQS